MKDVKKITPEIIKEASKNIKSGKSDLVWNFSSDFIKNGPNLLFEDLSIVIQAYFIHGHISEFLLLATLVSIVKDKLKNICDSKNYRSIAISSLILKLLDWIIILIWGESLKLDALQFGFQKDSSTMLCSWLVLEIISSYLKKGSNVYCCLMDFKKAFDTVQHSLLFKKMLKTGCPF